MHPGVVVVSVGGDKAEIIKECIRRGLINHLVIDMKLADALEEAFELEAVLKPF